VNGLLNLLKPTGMTSHDAVNAVRRLIGQKRVGHTGTLDPGAAGVLPICMGLATRIAEYLGDVDKEYRAEMVLGLETDTLDSFGHILRSAAAGHIEEHRVRLAMDDFTGAIRQVPPMVSAVKIGGKRLYELARSGQEVNRPAREVTIHQLRLLKYYPDAEHPRVLFHVRCSKGTYVRSLCADIGQTLGCGASLYFLTRTRSGPFTIGQAYTFEELADLMAAGDFSFVLPMDFGIGHLPRVVLNRDAVLLAINGRPVPARGAVDADPAGHGSAVRVYAPSEELLGIGETVLEDGILSWRMKKVFRQPD